MSKDEKLYKIGDLAKQVNKTPRTLRLYEELGLLTPRERSEGGFRLYGSEAFERIKCLEHLQTLGLSLNSIAGIFENARTGKAGASVVQDLSKLLSEGIQGIDVQIKLLQELRVKLEAARAFYDRCFGCTETKLFEACRNCDRAQNQNLPEFVRGLIGLPIPDKNCQG